MTDNPIAANYEPLKSAWPEVVPLLTFAEARTAARRLFRLAGVKCPAKIEETTGNRHSWVRSGVLRINVDRRGWGPDGTGWRDLVHMVSHWCFRSLEPRSLPHCEAHADLERRMANLVITSGWLDGRLKPEPQPVTVRDRPAERAAHAAKMLARAETRLKRAETIAKKWAARVRYYERKNS
jgi:hypothetical protein